MTVLVKQLSQIDLKRPNSRVQFTKTGPSAPCDGITARVPVGGFQGPNVVNDEVDTDYFVFSARINPNDFKGGLSSGQWQVYVNTTGGSLANYTLRLVDELGTVYDSLVVANGLPYTMLPLRPFTPDPLATHDYMLRVVGTPGTTNDILVQNFQVYVDAVKAKKIVHRIPFGAYGDGSGGGYGNNADNNYNAYSMDLTSEPVFSDGNQGATLLWLLDLAKTLGGSVSYSHEVFAAMNWNAGVHTVGKLAFRNATSGNMVTASEVSIISDVPARYTAPVSGVEFTDGSEFKEQFQFTPVGLGQDLFVYQFYLVVTVNCPTDLQLFNNIMSDCHSVISGGDRYELGARFVVDFSKYEPGVVWRQEATAADFGAVPGGTFELLDTGAATSGTAGAVVAGSQLTGFPAFPTFSRVRSGSLVLVDGRNVMPRHSINTFPAPPGGPALALPGVAFLIAEVSA